MQSSTLKIRKILVINKTRLILFLYFFSLIAALLYPFNFTFIRQKNYAERLNTANGIRFERKGQIISKSSVNDIYRKLTAGKGLSIEVLIQPYNVLQSGPARILSYSLDTSIRNFTLAQSGENLVMRLRTVSTNVNGQNPHVEVADIFETNKIYHIVVAYNFQSECIYINGKKIVCDYRIQGEFSNWDKTCKLVIGNEAAGNRPWLGEIYFAAIYDKALSDAEVKAKFESGFPDRGIPDTGERKRCSAPVAKYLFNEKKGVDIFDTGASAFKTNLYIPEKIYTNPKVEISKDSLTVNIVDKKDIVLNIIGFMPLGFLSFRFFKPEHKLRFKHYFLILIIGLAVSVVCEFLQLFLPDRHSSIVDLLANMMGVMTGIIISRFSP
jgi:hypothetical protein